MDCDELGYADFITMQARQPCAARDPVHVPDFAALADAERADAEALRLV